MYERAASVVTSSCTVVRGSWSLRTMSGAESVPSPSRKSSSMSRARVTAGTRRPTTGPLPMFEISTADRHDEHRLLIVLLHGQWVGICEVRGVTVHGRAGRAGRARGEVSGGGGDHPAHRGDAARGVPAPARTAGPDRRSRHPTA